MPKSLSLWQICKSVLLLPKEVHVAEIKKPPGVEIKVKFPSDLRTWGQILKWKLTERRIWGLW
jgi:hypothetical protein